MEIQYKSRNVEIENDFKRRWHESVVNGTYSRSPSYERVNSPADLERMLRQSICWGKVDRLEHVLQNRFHYDYQRRTRLRHGTEL